MLRAQLLRLCQENERAKAGHSDLPPALTLNSTLALALTKARHLRLGLGLGLTLALALTRTKARHAELLAELQASRAQHPAQARPRG